MKDQSNKNDALKETREFLKKEIFKNYSTVEQFCWDHDLNKATISNFLNNKKDFRVSTLIQIAEALDNELIIRFD
jgi:hypothetical protein